MHWIWIVIAVIVFDLLVAFPLLWLVIRNAWSGLAQRYPAQEPAPEAVRRNFQSFRFGVANFGLSVHVAADDQHLHLIPARFLRFFGARPASIGWDRLRIVRRSRNGKYTWVKVDALTIMGPAWCLDLAAPAAEAASGLGEDSRSGGGGEDS